MKKVRFYDEVTNETLLLVEGELLDRQKDRLAMKLYIEHDGNFVLYEELEEG